MRAGIRGTFVTPRWLVRTLIGDREMDRCTVSAVSEESARDYGRDWLVCGGNPEAVIDVTRLPD